KRCMALVVPLLLWSGATLAQTTTSPSSMPNTPQTLEGQVVKIDRNQGRVTIRANDGTMHEFQASAETLKDLKEGDRLEAKLRGKSRAARRTPIPGPTGERRPPAAALERVATGERTARRATPGRLRNRAGTSRRRADQRPRPARPVGLDLPL